jgi:hypothetical protein
MNYRVCLQVIIVCSVIFLFCSSGFVSACKNIITTGDATLEDYNFLLKVRDPSRSGAQVLCKIPQGYEYTYHYPWSGNLMPVVVHHSYIGITSENDVPANIVKSGMVLTDAGLAFGDADSLSRWVNPTRYAWDDFDWIRFSSEQASTEKEAIYRLTNLAVDQLHPTAVSENLCLVGPEKGYIIEADAVRYHVKEIIDDVDVISNYPRVFWNTQILRSRLIADRYNAEKTEFLEKGDSIHLNRISRVRVVDINNDSVVVRQIPFFTNVGYHDGRPILRMPAVTISVGEQKTVGYFYVSVLNVTNTAAKLHVTTAVYAWQQELLNIIQPKKGNITMNDMINWSRLQQKDLHYVRPMCEEEYPYEGVAIYQIPSEKYETLSMGWFSTNRAVSSIYVPFHISNTKIYEPYMNGDAAYLSLWLYENCSDMFLYSITSVEHVFLTENSFFNNWAHNTLVESSNISAVLTTIDVSMKKQAFLMQHFYYDISQQAEYEQQIFMDLIKNIWCCNYTVSIYQMADLLQLVNATGYFYFFKQRIIDIMQNIVFSFIDCIKCIGVEINSLLYLYTQANELINQQLYLDAACIFEQIIFKCHSYFI